MKNQSKALARASKPSPVQVSPDGYTLSGDLAVQVQALAIERGVALDEIVSEALEAFAAAKPKVELDGDLGEVVTRLGRVQNTTPQAALNKIVGPAVRKFAEGIDDESDFRLPPKLAAKMDREPEFEGRVPVQIQLPPDMLQRARHHACHGSFYLSDWIAGLIELEDFRSRRLCSTHWQD